MSDLNEYKCPACGAPIHYDITKESMTCHFCNSTFDLEYIKSHIIIPVDEKLSDFDWVERSRYVWEPYEPDGLEEFTCPSCGGTIVTKAFYATAKCPFCRNYVIISSDLDGDIRPDKVIPFKVPSNVFLEKYTEYISEFKNVPREFRSKDVQKKIVGCFIPVWRYSCTYRPEEQFDISVNHYPILANDADICEEVFYSLLPFEYSDSEDFSESYIAGFSASRYIIGAENAMKSTDSVLQAIYNEESGVKAISNKTEAEKPLDTGRKMDRLLKVGLNKYIQNRKLSYYLVPVWLLDITYNGEKFTYAMNGQTGKMRVDNVPKKSKAAVWTWLIYPLLQALLIACAYLAVKRMGMGVIILILVLAFFISVFNYYFTKSMRKKLSEKRVYFKSGRFEEQKVWSINDFMIRH
ncbi:hypothetical protein [Ruminococcus sp.]|uniref:hypothetical protein n=1 Tax=Ruminococcus sp. TaxID=41978 RepID=UPI0025ECFBCD|nr:hypothetical protein [Ruminococcus sp.]